MNQSMGAGWWPQAVISCWMSRMSSHVSHVVVPILGSSVLIVYSAVWVAMPPFLRQFIWFSRNLLVSHVLPQWSMEHMDHEKS